MEVYRTEDEQIEAIKRWLRTNGPGLLLAIGLGLAVAFGWRFWTERQELQRQQGGAQYEALLQAVEQARQQGSPEARATARTLAADMKSDFEDSAYGVLAAMFGAAVAVDAGDLDQAAEELRWVLGRQPEAHLAALARYRLARVLMAQGEPAEATVLLDEGAPGAYAFAFERLRGDILLAEGDRAGARAAYERAQSLQQEMASVPNDPLLELKLRDLAPLTVATEEPAE